MVRSRVVDGAVHFVVCCGGCAGRDLKALDGQVTDGTGAVVPGAAVHARVQPGAGEPIQSGASWHASIFEPNDFAAVQTKFPIVLESGSDSVPFTAIGGNDNTYPQGRKVTQWQINDNLTWTHGKHTRIEF